MDDSIFLLERANNPEHLRKERFLLYSLPATPGFSPSPSPSPSLSPSPSPSRPATPCLFGNAYSPSFDVFEFETSRRFDGRIGADKRQGWRLGLPLPEMTFADELFSNGIVLPLLPPLKLPPRLQPGNGGKKSTTASSPRSPISVPKSKFSRNCSFDADFDPFTAALEAVRKDGARTVIRQSYGGTSGLKANKNANMGLHSPLAQEATGPRPMILSRSGWADLKGLATTMKFRLVKTELESRLGPLKDSRKKENDTREPMFFSRRKSKKPSKAGFTKRIWVPCTLGFPKCLGFGRKYGD